MVIKLSLFKSNINCLIVKGLGLALYLVHVNVYASYSGTSAGKNSEKNDGKSFYGRTVFIAEITPDNMKHDHGSVDTENPQAQECVILLHGMARSHRSLTTMTKALKAEGYYTVNHHYPSTKHPIEKLAEDAISAALLECSQLEQSIPASSDQLTQFNKIHFVTHSLGGILVRQYIAHHSIANLGRVVMLGPPNKGSEVVDKLKSVPGFSYINGPAGLQLGTDSLSIPNMLGAANFDLGIIAGSRSMNIILSTMLPNPDDGKVSVSNTKLDGMSDHITLPVTHPLMMNNPNVIFQTKHFLQHGRFDRITSE